MTAVLGSRLANPGPQRRERAQDARIRARAESLGVTKSEVIRLAETRIEYVVAFSFLCAIGDTLSAALRGYGNSIGPAVIAFFAICGSRLAWVFLIFPSYRTFANLLLCYPLSWILAAVLLGIYYRTFMRHLRI